MRVDVMVFSITFGRNQAGKLSMDFGAVNREGGERRLNVAVTRAKSEFHVFSSISAEDIDLRRGKGVGVSHLKSYLDYAERGSMALATMDEGSLGPAENPFEASVADALQSRGWEVRTQIGVSGFRIDLGVVHPDKAGAYLAGIECDGATYHRSATARDRDQIREGVLRNLGWEILRLWSTDWFMHRDEALDRIDKTLKELLERRREKARQQAEVERDRLEEPEAPDLGGSNEPDQIDDLDEDEAEVERQELYASQQLLSQPSTSPDAGQDDELEDEYDCDASLFFEPSYAPRLTKVIDRVVAKYGPMSETMLYRHIAKLHGWQRAGRRIQERVMACIGENECRKENGNLFVWQPGSHREMLPFRSHLGRAPRDVPKAEILWLIHEHNQVLRSSDPAKDIATLLGLGRLSADTRAYLDSCIAEYERRREGAND